jgi:hypothetical protein
LISMGNERQRKAIDSLREQVVLWAMQDLRIKRAGLARDVHVENPLGWLNKVAARVCGYDLNLQVVEVLENPPVLICATGDGSVRVVFTPHSPRDIHAMKRVKQNRLSQYSDQNPLLFLPRNATAFECSVLNNEILFDLELPLTWKGLTGQTIDQMDRVWVYIS